MRINNINPAIYQAKNLKCAVRKNSSDSLTRQNNQITSDQVAFKGTGGKLIGGGLGLAFAGLIAIAGMGTPATWIALTSLISSEIGGAVIGGMIGDKIEGKDKDND